MFISHHQVRRVFIDFFVNQGYRSIASASLIPANDPSLLFVNSGMAPLKRFFLKQDHPPHKLLTSVQKCIRAGGKHNDLELIGKTKRHHSFFEMCGNFAFGDLSKKEAIVTSWEFLTKELSIDSNRLSVTVHPNDREAYTIWQDIVCTDQISFDRDNVWSAGDEGPCGLCSEIYYDHKTGNADDVVEIWNLVFITHNIKGQHKELLPCLCIDTGMGLERILSVLGGSADNYNIPFFRKGIELIEQISGIPCNVSHRIIVDHIRCCCFMIAEGVMVGNSGREYVLKRILRRTIRHESKLTSSKPILNVMIDHFIEEFKDVYQELYDHQDIIHNVVNSERGKYNQIYSIAVAQLDKTLEIEGHCSPEYAFKLYDTYGLHIDLIQEILQDHELSLDIDRFNQLLELSKQKSSQTKSYQGIDISMYEETVFLGYEENCIHTRVLDYITFNNKSILILDSTVFYPEGGGQESDRGLIKGNDWQFEVYDVQKYNGIILHFGYLTGNAPNAKDECLLTINLDRRTELTKHHSATHLLLEALRSSLGKTVLQKGSLVKQDSLRLDFLYDSPIDINLVERDVNLAIQKNFLRSAEWTSLKDAKEKGALSTFGDKYGEVVRVISMGSSVELCGGTHVERTGDIGSFYILKEYGISANVRRIEAVCGMSAYEHAKNQITKIDRLSNKYKVKVDRLEDIIDSKINNKQKAGHVIIDRCVRHLHCHNRDFHICYMSGSNIHKSAIYKSIDDNIDGADFVCVINKINETYALTLKSNAPSSGLASHILLHNLVKVYHGKSGGKAGIAHGSVIADSIQAIMESLESIISSAQIN